MVRGPEGPDISCTRSRLLPAVKVDPPEASCPSAHEGLRKTVIFGNKDAFSVNCSKVSAGNIMFQSTD